jgi:hypothetical protein
MFVFLPMLFVLVITLWALIELCVINLRAIASGNAAVVNAIAAGTFIVLALFLATRAWQARTPSP